jgi:hypothetical protein
MSRKNWNYFTRKIRASFMWNRSIKKWSLKISHFCLFKYPSPDGRSDRLVLVSVVTGLPPPLPHPILPLVKIPSLKKQYVICLDIENATPDVSYSHQHSADCCRRRESRGRLPPPPPRPGWSAAKEAGGRSRSREALPYNALEISMLASALNPYATSRSHTIIRIADIVNCTNVQNHIY